MRHAVLLNCVARITPLDALRSIAWGRFGTGSGATNCAFMDDRKGPVERRGLNRRNIAVFLLLSIAALAAALFTFDQSPADDIPKVRRAL